MKKRALIIVILLTGFYLIFSLSKSTYSLWQKTEMIKEAQKESEEEEKRNRDLRKELDSAQTQEFIEKEAREKLNLVRPGETIVILPPFDSTPSTSEAALPNWQKWWKLFF